MEAVETIIGREPWEIEPRLKELGLTRDGLLEVRDVAIHESSNATPFHAANAAGTYSYHGGTWALRDRFVGADWTVDRSDGVELIKNDKLKVKVAFSNVDLACNTAHIPKPRTKKGLARNAPWAMAFLVICHITLPARPGIGSSSISWWTRMVPQN
jgi:hypothetical protein